MSRVTIAHLPKPVCYHGFTCEQVVEIMGDRLDEFNRWMVGSTRIMCQLRTPEQEAFLKAHEEWYGPYRAGCTVAHGVITFTTDVERFLRGLPQND